MSSQPHSRSTRHKSKLASVAISPPSVQLPPAEASIASVSVKTASAHSTINEGHEEDHHYASDDAETLSSDSALELIDDHDAVVVSNVTTRSANGISKKRILADAASLSDVESLPLDATPTKKSRVSGSAHSAVFGSESPLSSVSSDSIDDNSTVSDTSLSMSPLKLVPAGLSSAARSTSTGPDPFQEPSDDDHANETLSSAIVPGNPIPLPVTLDKDPMLSTPKARPTFNDMFPAAKSRPTFNDVFPAAKNTLMMTSGPVLLEDTMKFAIKSLPDVCEVTHPILQDVALAADYSTLPHLRAGELYSWAAKASGTKTPITTIRFSQWSEQCAHMDYGLGCDAVRFVRYKQFINPCRISPLHVNILYSGNERKKSILQCNFRTAICLTPVYAHNVHLQAPVTYGLRNKFLAGFLHSQEWQRFEAFCCMVFDRPSMQAQIVNNALAFTTLGDFGKDRENSSPVKAPRNPNIFYSAASSSTTPVMGFSPSHFKQVLNHYDHVPVYDSQKHIFNFSTDLENLNSVLPFYTQEVRDGAFVVVGYTLGHYDMVKDGQSRSCLTTNILFAIVLAD